METNVVSRETKNKSTPDTMDGEKQNLHVGLVGISDHASCEDGSTRTKSLVKEEPLINKPMYSSEDWEILYELKSLDGRKTDMCCVKAHALYCYYSMRIKLSRATPMNMGDPNIFVIPTTGLPNDDAVSVADVRAEVPDPSTATFDARTETIERKRKFTFMSTVMEVQDKERNDSDQLSIKHKTPIQTTVTMPTSEALNDVIGLKSPPDTFIGKIQREPKGGRLLRMYRWVRRKLRM